MLKLEMYLALRQRNIVRLTMSTYLTRKSFVPEQWVSQAEAAQMRGVSRQAIAKLVKKGRFTTLIVAGKILLRKSEVEKFKPQPPGPAPKKPRR